MTNYEFYTFYKNLYFNALERDWKWGKVFFKDKMEGYRYLYITEAGLLGKQRLYKDNN